MILVPRDSSDPVVRFVDTNESTFISHYCNGFEQTDGTVVIDAIAMDSFPLAPPAEEGQEVLKHVDFERDVPFATLVRYKLAPKGSSNFEVTKETLSKRLIEFPVVNPSFAGRVYRFIYAVGGRDLHVSCPPQILVKIDTFTGQETTWSPEPHQFLGEPCFVSRITTSTASIHQQQHNDNNSNNNNNNNNNRAEDLTEDSGYILTYLNDGKALTTEILIFNAQEIASGPISRCLLPVYVPPGLHGSFAPGLVFDPELVQQKFASSKEIDSRNWGEAL